MSCTGCDDNKIPLTLATGANGTDGESVFIAFASSSDGEDFSYTPADNLPYISFVTKTGSTVTQAEFTTWTLYHGADGTNGTNGIYVTSAALNASGELILTMSDASTINAGTIPCCEDATWKTLTLTNDWDSQDPTLKAKAEYLIDKNNFIHFRGTLNDAAATNAAFATLALTSLNMNLFSSISDTSTASVHSSFEINNGTATLKINNYGSGGTTYWLLESIPPLHIR
jgi:hypothetical protein